jgi:membrane-associated phospholipid phosphatase
MTQQPEEVAAPSLAARARAFVADTRLPGALPVHYRERALILTLLWVYTFGTYYLLGLWSEPSAGSSLHTRVDDWIPFWPTAMFAYEGVYTALLFPLFTIRCQRLFRRTAAGYFLVATLCLLIWIAYPVSAVTLRADASQLDTTLFVEWGVRVNYALDPPLNCFPSLHLAITLLAALCAWKANRVYGAIGLAGAVAVAYAICAVKQHYFVDGVAGAAVAIVVYVAVVARYDSGESLPEEVAFTWRGPAGYFALHFAIVLGFVLAWLLGWAPWESVNLG